jgi:translation initiation factor eIF-2B subunit epsilon
VSNMSLTQVLKEHKERKKKDSNAVMTMVIRRSKPSPITRQSRLGTDELFMAIDPNSKQLLYYEDKADYSKVVICLDKMLLTDNPSISLHNDAQVYFLNLSLKSFSFIFRVSYKKRFIFSIRSNLLVVN